jgi:hypothetical protein
LASVAHSPNVRSATAAVCRARALGCVPGVLGGVSISRAAGGGPQEAMRVTTLIAGSPAVRISTLAANLDPPTARPTKAGQIDLVPIAVAQQEYRERGIDGCWLVDRQHDLGVVGDGLEAQTRIDGHERLVEARL